MTFKTMAAKFMYYDDIFIKKVTKIGTFLLGNNRMDKSILEVMHETAKGLHRAGAMDDVKYQGHPTKSVIIEIGRSNISH